MSILFGCGSGDMIIKCTSCKNEDTFEGKYLEDCVGKANLAGWKIISEDECYCKKCRKKV